jgi:hypothetical protein
MPVIQGGQVIGQTAGVVNPGTKVRVYRSVGAPTDANIGYGGTPANGTIAEDTVTGNVYERQAGVWVRIDTL